MEKKYVIKLKGIDCYLKGTNGKNDFTFDLMKAKVFTENGKPDLIAKLTAGEYKPSKSGYTVDFIRLTMDKRTWQELYTDNLDQLRSLSENRLMVHNFSFSLADKLKVKNKTYNESAAFPNFECEYYGEDFERKYL